MGIDFSITFDFKGNREIGLYFSAWVLIPFVNKGFTFVIFRFYGKVLSFIDKFIMLVRWIAITGTTFLISLAEIWSIPEALATSKFFKILSHVVTSTFAEQSPHIHFEYAFKTLQ